MWLGWALAHLDARLGTGLLAHSRGPWHDSGRCNLPKSVTNSYGQDCVPPHPPNSYVRVLTLDTTEGDWNRTRGL